MILPYTVQCVQLRTKIKTIQLYSYGTDMLTTFVYWNLKELYTSISTLAQKLVLTLLNNEFILKILISTPFGRKIRKRFRLKNH